MTIPEKIHKSLLVGTSRSPLGLLSDQADFPNELSQIIDQSDSADLRLWQAVALHDLWQRSGYLPQQMLASADPIVVQGEEEKRFCPNKAVELLSLILRDIHPELLSTWLFQAKLGGYVLPARFIVPLLKKATNNKSLQEAVQPVLGARGVWLSQQHPDWRSQYSKTVFTLTNDTAQSTWPTAQAHERPLLLKRIRLQDPALGRQLLQQDWLNESPENRALLLACLLEGLSIDDQSFLEQALDDKRKEVRVIAQDLLRQLPDSDLVARCIKQIENTFTLNRSGGVSAMLGAVFGKLGASNFSLELQLTLPESIDKGMKRDGLGTQNYPGLGEKASLLRDLLRSVPASYWSETWQCEKSQILQLFIQNEFKDALVQGLVLAINQVDTIDEKADWIKHLITALSKDQFRLDYQLMQAIALEIHGLPISIRDEILLGCLGRASPQDQHLLSLWSQLHQSKSEQERPHKASVALSHAWLKFIQQKMMAAKNNAWEVRQQLKQLSYWLDVSDLQYTEHAWPASDWEYWPQWRDTIQEFHTTLQFRQQIERSFMESTG